MIFSSLEFLFFFFPIVLGVYFVLPKFARNYWLLSASLFFYAWAEPTFFLLLIISILVNFSGGLWLDRLNMSLNSVALSGKENLEPSYLKKKL